MSECRYGCDNGIVIYVHPHTGASGAYRCRCELGRKYDAGWTTKWRERRGLKPIVLALVPVECAPAPQERAAGTGDDW